MPVKAAILVVMVQASIRRMGSLLDAMSMGELAADLRAAATERMMEGGREEDKEAMEN